MKKKVFLPLLGIAMASAAGVVTVNNFVGNSSNDLLLANIEALAETEESGETCYDTITEKENSKVFFCGSCDYVENSEEATWSKTKKCTPS